MRNPDNMKQIEYNTNKYSILKLESIPKYDREDYDLLDNKDFSKYIKDIERICRQSFEYRQMINYLRENLNMNCCSFFKNVNNIDTFKIRLEIHHHPLTLFDLCVIIFNKRSFYRESLEPEAVAKEVMFLHYNLYVGLIPLSETVHELVHNNYLFIPMDKVLGKYQEFINLYEQFMTPEQLDVLERNIEASRSYYDDLEMNPLLQKSYVYLDVTGAYDLPTFEHVIQTMSNRINELKGEPVTMEKETQPRYKKVMYSIK